MYRFLVNIAAIGRVVAMVLVISEALLSLLAGVWYGITRSQESVSCHKKRRFLAALAERKLRTEVRPPHVLPGSHS